MKILLQLLTIACLLGRVGEALGQTKRPMTFEDLQQMKRVSDPQISPSGKWAMFSVTDVSLEKNSKVNHLWVVPLSTGSGDGSGTPNSQARNMGHLAGDEMQVTSGTGESNGRFAPDGQSVSWTADDAQGVPQIVVAAWDDAVGKPGISKVLTDVSTGAEGAIWSPDSKRLLFTSSVYPECSDKPNWQMEEACDKAKDEAAAKNPVKAEVWEHLLFRHWNRFTGEKRSHVLVVDATYGPAIRDLTPRHVVGDAETPTFSLGGPLGYAWAPDSKEIAYVTNLDPVPAASTNNDVFTLRLDQPGAAAVKVSTSAGSDDGPAYSPDGKYLAFRSQLRAGYESDRFRLMLFDRAEKTTRDLLPKFDRWVDEFVWGHGPVSPQNATWIYFVSADLGAAPIFRVDTAGLNLEQLNVSGEYSDLQTAMNGSVLVAGRMRLFEPERLVSVDLHTIAAVAEDVPEEEPAHVKAGAKKAGSRKAGARKAGAGKVATRKIAQQNLPPSTGAVQKRDTETILTHANDAVLAQLDLDRSISGAGSFWFAGANNQQVEGFIVEPPNFDPEKKYPLKFLIHGGPQGAWGDAWSYRWNAELMAADGYVVVMVNPRGSTGYGQKFIDGVNGDWGGKAYLDLMKGLDAAEAQFPFIDKTRECALGASYGGFMANWILTHTTRFKCIVTHDGMYNPPAAYGDTEEVWFNEWEFRRAADFPGEGKGGRSAAAGAVNQNGRPAQPWRYAAGPVAQDPFRKWSPMLSIAKARTPTLVIHSQRDYRLDVSEGFQLFTALQRLGVPSKMLYFPDEGHWVLKPQNSKLWYETVGDWCDRWTRTGKYADSRAGQVAAGK